MNFLFGELRTSLEKDPFERVSNRAQARETARVLGFPLASDLFCRVRSSLAQDDPVISILKSPAWFRPRIKADGISPDCGRSAGGSWISASEVRLSDGDSRQ